MTTLVRGPIKLVTDRPDTVRKVSIRAPELRLHGAGIVTAHNDDIPVRDGQVEFEALPGPAVLTLVTAGGAPLRSVDIVVPDEDTATLSECLDQIYVYDPPVVGRAQQFAREAGEFAARAEAGADRVGSAEQVGAWVGEAEVLHDGTVAAAEHAETQAGIATEQAGVAAGHAEQAGEDRAQTGADRRQTGEDRAQTGEDREAAEGWASQSKDAATLAITAAATVTQYVGDGFPEGRVAAPVGAVYTDRQATSGAVRWIKTQGAGSTGWRVSDGDTKWRDVTSTAASGVTVDTGGKILLRRVGSTVYWSLFGVRTGGTNSYGAIAPAPDGFRVDMNTTVMGLGYTQPATARFDVQPNFLRYSGATVSAPIAPVTDRVIVSVPTYQQWPTSLPGTPA